MQGKECDDKKKGRSRLLSLDPSFRNRPWLSELVPCAAQAKGTSPGLQRFWGD